MEGTEELSRHELSALKDIRLSGRTADRAVAKRLLADDMIVAVEGGSFELTAEGRRLLVRGSPALWTLAA